MLQAMFKELGHFEVQDMHENLPVLPKKKPHRRGEIGLKPHDDTPWKVWD